MAENRVFLDPQEFTEKDLPIVVLVDDLRGGLGFLIKEHTSGNYNHAMIMVKPGKVVTQNNLLKELDIKDYLKSYKMLKFWSIKNLTKDEKRILCSTIAIDLSKPWWERLYDYVGIFGQAIKIPVIQWPWAKYCSESVAGYLRLIPRFVSWLSRVPNPSEMDAVFKKHPADVEVKGYWWSD